MTWREWTATLFEWPGWRRHAPAGLSFAAHGVVLAGLASLMATATPSVPIDRYKLMLSVDLLPAEILREAEPEVMAGVSPPPRAPAEPAPKRETNPSSAAPRSSSGPATSAPGPTAVDGDSVYLPPSILAPDAPAGLRSLMTDDPCVRRYGPRAKECAGKDLAARTGPMDSVLPRSADQLAQHFGDYMPGCGLRTGCEGGEWISSNGTRGVGPPPPGSAGDRGVMAGMAGGAGGLGGLNTSVGRLGFNRDHTDPGFGD